jgi:hypothetical protein
VLGPRAKVDLELEAAERERARERETAKETARARAQGERVAQRREVWGERVRRGREGEDQMRCRQAPKLKTREHVRTHSKSNKAHWR